MATGVLLINTGTPDEPTVESIRAYLYEFLMDPAIIGVPKPIRKMIVGHISASRPRRTVERYKGFWTDEGSPFLLACQRQAAALQKLLEESMDEPVYVQIAMRYGNPSIRSGLEALRDAGCDAVVLLPSYPQQVNVCAGTCLAEAEAQLADLAHTGWKPLVRRVGYFYDQPSYQKALADQVAKTWTWKPGSKLIVSFHSTLLHDIEQGDPYYDQAVATRDNLVERLGIPSEDVLLSFQSRFDGRKWLQPFTDQVVTELAQQGVRDICIVCPIFTARNIETAVEIAQDLRQDFLRACGEPATFTHVPELDDDPGLIRALALATLAALEGTGHHTVPLLPFNKELPAMKTSHDM